MHRIDFYSKFDFLDIVAQNAEITQDGLKVLNYLLNSGCGLSAWNLICGRRIVSAISILYLQERVYTDVEKK